MTPAETCRANGWTVGTVLEGTEVWPDGSIHTDRIIITAIGEECILVRRLKERGRSSEGQWTLKCREWRRVK